MPGLQPIPVNIKEEEWKDAKPQLLRALNYIIKDVYNWIGRIQGIENSDPILSMGVHTHQATDQGGDYGWADITDAQVTYLAALVAAITVTNLLDKTADEEISGTWKLTDLTASRVLGLNASKEIEAIAAAAGTVTVITALQEGGDPLNLQYKSRDLTVSEGLITTIGAESAWTNVAFGA